MDATAKAYWEITRAKCYHLVLNIEEEGAVLQV
jgi:hypothetical protein